ncbi:MAG: glycosyltransferase family 4 protein [Pseudomonadota bacterium]
MQSVKKIAFYAPIKPPDHPIPSGDRVIAGNLLKAFRLGGYKVLLASRYIAYSKRHAEDILSEKKQGALQETDALLDAFKQLPESEKPDLWVTYHPYCKAPDWIGSTVSQKLGIPYVNVEAAKTGQGGPDDFWRPWRLEAQKGIKQADLHIVLKPTDIVYLEDLLGHNAPLQALSPFLDLSSLQLPARDRHSITWQNHSPVIATTGMMRPGKKERNFLFIAETLEKMIDQDWNLLIIGGGPQEAEIRNAFSEIPQERIHWTGQVEHAEMAGLLQQADIFFWPGWNEPIGMVFLEAQSLGLPVIAFESMGVPLVVKDNETGLLAPEGDVSGLRENLSQLLGDRDKRKLMGAQARERVLKKHTLQAAAARLQELIEML